MATSDSQARIRITAKDETKSAFASASKSLAALDNVAGGLQGQFLALGPVIASAFSIQAFQGVVNLLDQLNDISDATGSSIESLSKLEGVAKRNGASMDEVASILVKFNGALNDAKPDSPVARALAAIGFSAEELRRDDPADALQKVAKGLAQFADDGDKARAVQELFGKSVKDAAPFLKDLAEAGKLNASATEEQAKQAELFNKNMAALKATSELYARDLASGLLPAFNGFVEALDGVVSKQTELTTGGAALRTFLETITVLGANVAFVFKGIGNELGGMAAQTAALAKLDFDAFRAIGREMEADAKRARETLDALERRIMNRGGYTEASYSNEGRSAARSLSLPAAAEPKKRAGGARAADEFVGPPLLEETALALRAIEQTDVARIKELQLTLDGLLMMQGAGGPEGTEQALKRTIAQLEELDPAARDAAKAQAAIDALLANTPSAQVERYARDIDLLAGALEKTADPKRAQQLREALASAQENMQRIGKGSEETLEKLSVFADEASRNIQDALGDTLEQALQGNFDNIGQMWLQLIQRMTAQALAAKLNEALFGGASGGGGGLLGTIGGALFGGATSGGGGGDFMGPPNLGATGMAGPAFGPSAVTPAAAGGAGTTVINVAAGPTRNEVLTAIQMAQRASDAKFEARLRRAGIT